MANKKRTNHRKLNMILPPKKRKKTMDPKLVAAKQKAEIAYIHRKFKIATQVVAAAVRKVGRSRSKVYAELRAQGYTIKTRTHK